MATNETTTKFKVDISELKKGITEANRQIRLANAEFKSATASMDKWSTSTDGLTAKITQTEKVLAAQNKILDSYKQELDAVTAEYGENSKEADNARIKYENQRAAVLKSEKQLSDYKNALSNLQAEEKAQAEALAKENSAFGTLQKTISEQETELSDLKKQYAAVVLEEGKNSDSAKDLANQISALSSDLKDNKSKMSEAEDAADQFDKSLDEMSSSSKDAESGIGAMQVALGSLVSAGIQKAVDAIKDLVKYTAEAWKDYDEGADIIIAATGATGDAADELMEVYKNVSKNVVSDFSDIGTAVGEVNTRFGTTGTDLEDLSTKFLKFVQLNGTDLKNAIDTTQSAMAAWGVSAEDAGLMLDLLNKAGQDTGVSVDALSASLVSNAPALQEMGFSVSDATMFLANLEKSGVDASSTMAGLKKALNNAAAEGTPMADAMAEMEDSIKNASSSTEAITIASELFGSKSAAAIATAVRDGRLSFSELGTAMSDFEGNVENTFEDTQDAPDKFALAVQGIKTDLADVADSLMNDYAPQIEDALSTVRDDIIPAVKDGIKWLIDNLPLIKTAIVAITAALVAFNVASAIQGIVKAWQAYKTATEGATLAQWLLNAAMNANPLGIIIAAIAALVAAFIYLWNTSDEFREFWLGLWDTLKETVSGVIDAISEFFTNAWETIKETVTAGLEFIGGILSTVAEWVIKIVFFPIITYYVTMFNLVKTVASAAWEFLKSIFSVVASWFNANVIQPVTKFFSDLWNGIKSSAMDAWNFIVSVWTAVASWFNLNIIQPVSNFFSGLWNGLKTGASNAWEGIKSVFSTVTTFFKDKFTEAWTAVKNIFSTGGKIFDGIKDGIVSSFKNIVNAIIRGINKVVSIPFGTINSILDKIKNLSILGQQPFKNLISTINTPTIPELASGGVLRRGQIGLLEGSGAEAVVPLENNQKWIAATASALRQSLRDEGLISQIGGSSKIINNNFEFNQTNTSPKALNPVEIYRQTDSLFFKAQARLSNV